MRVRHLEPTKDPGGMLRFMDAPWPGRSARSEVAPDGS